jgi:ABC-type glycerol-3-phosphate transport system substrate-binding protein
MRVKILKNALSLLMLFMAGGLLWAGGGQQTADGEESSSGKLFPKTREITVLVNDHGSRPFKEHALSDEAIFEKTNIRIKYDILSATSGDERLHILAATNQLPEIAKMSENNHKTYALSGIFLPVLKYITPTTMPNYYRFWDGIVGLRKTTINGDPYSFHMVARNETDFAYAPVIRVDLLAKHNIPVPKTFDDLLDALEALKKIYPDSRPWTTRNGTKQLFATAAYMLGSGWDTPGYYYGTPLYYDKFKDGGTYIYGPATPEFKTVLKFFADAYRRGILDPDYATNTTDQWRARLTGGQSFFYLDNSSFSMDFTLLLKKIDPAASLEVIPFLTNSYGQRRAISYGTEYEGTVYGLRSDIKDPDQVVKFMDWLYSDEGSDITNFGKEGVSFRYNAQHKPELIPEYVAQFRNTSSPFYSISSEAGIGKLGFSPYGSNTELDFAVRKILGLWNEENEKHWGLMATEAGPDGALIQPNVNPPLSNAENERVVELNMALSTYLDQEYDKYIMGKEPIDNWDKVIQEAVRLGARELEAIYNKANASYK